MPSQMPIMLSKSSISSHHILLQAAALFALADLPTVAIRTSVTGTASVLDVFLLAPGMHRQQAVDDINHGEFPTTGAMTTGYVFRVENPATVSYLQNIGRTGHLVTARVSPNPSRNESLSRINRRLQSFFAAGVPATLFYVLGPLLTLVVVALMGAIQDWWGLGVLGMFMLSRAINVGIVKRRTLKGWKGIAEPGVNGDLLILLSQDRWIRLQGLVDDLKTVTAGQWLRDKTMIEGFATSFATLLVYAAVILAFNASTVGSLMIASLLLCSSALLDISNSLTPCLQMFDCIVRVEGEPIRYERRLYMANEMIEKSGRNDWAIGMGLVVAKDPRVPVTV
ncbi:uncharacterized protein BT62DRAFT_934701 [Guyanagaster necrorhizus]|uniref:Uncharacterized protein n=1 Tax=Guyanagaster necrorhizus TaxID=856835 RepID=A0A9P8AQ61_9AGAR|nr:uncharacterized protein BT62DRAFT_934701 [Guyanagaster necrorhizus MCA 3950]KAG7443749.1 hypothetical protein BT62DRAFT_934701 [Guyanagaster necrorhizus MCA 3950]